MVFRPSDVLIQHKLPFYDENNSIQPHDRSSTEHNLEVGDKVLIDNQLFVSKDKKFSPMWIGPFEITKIINK